MKKESQTAQHSVVEISDSEQQLAISANEMLQEISSIQSQFLLCTTLEQMRHLFDRMLALVLKATSAEYGFIGEILYTSAAKPYLKIYAITNIAWDEKTRALYDEYAEKGMEFHNMDTLFGKAIMTQSVLIANDPYNDPRARRRRPPPW